MKYVEMNVTYDHRKNNRRKPHEYNAERIRMHQCNTNRYLLRVQIPCCTGTQYRIVVIKQN